MSLRERLVSGMRAIFGGVQGFGSDDGWLLRAVGGTKTKSGVPVNEWTALGGAPIWACVTLISDCMALFPVDVMERRGNQRLPVSDHPAQAVLNAASNDDMSASSMIATLQMHQELWGNAYSEVERTRRGEPVAMWPLLPDRTHPHVQVTNQQARQVRYRSQIDGRQIEIAPQNVVHVFGYSFDGLCGISPIQTHRNAVGLMLALEEFGSTFFQNDAKSGGVLMHPGKLSVEAKQNITNSFEKQGGLENAHKVKVLEEGMKFVPTSISPEDSQMLGTREFQLAEAARVYRVPLVLLQSLQGSTVWGTGIESLMIGFTRYTLAPKVKRWESELNRKLLTTQERERGLYITFNMNALLRSDTAARSAFYNAGIAAGWLTRNEAREDEGRNPLPGLDEPLVQSSMVPAGDLSAEGRQALRDTEANRRALQNVIEGRAITHQTSEAVQ